MCHETLTHLCMPVPEKLLRTVAVYAFLVIGLRLAGKRELGQFNAFDLVVLITLANAVQNAIIGPENTLAGGLIGAATLLATNFLVVRVAYRFPALDRLLEGKELTLYEKGRMNRKALQREVITEGELMSIVRRQGARSLNEVDRIVLERNGTVSVILREDVTILRILEEVGDIKRALAAR
ncbi:MAG: YetF domain-containing protein [Actinomycetota bacterium]